MHAFYGLQLRLTACTSGGASTAPIALKIAFYGLQLRLTACTSGGAPTAPIALKIAFQLMPSMCDIYYSV